MGLFKRKEPSQERAVTGEVIFEDALLAAMLGNGTVTKKIALQIPALSGGIDLIANIVASTPVKLYREEDGKADAELPERGSHRQRRE